MWRWKNIRDRGREGIINRESRREIKRERKSQRRKGIERF